MRILLFVFGLGWCACGSVRYSGPDAPGGSSGPAITLAIATPGVSVPLDGQYRIEVEVARSGGFAGPITVAGKNPPAGVTITPSTIAADATTGEVVIAGGAPLVIGSTVMLTLEATGDGVAPATASIAAPVTGKPGSLDTTFGVGGTGLAKIRFGADDDGIFAALDVIDGKIVATGYGTGGLGEVRMATARFTADGAVDPTWNGGALVRTNFGPTSSHDFAAAAATDHQADGRSIIIGTNHDATPNPPCPCTDDIAVARFSWTGGSGGADFGINGRSTIDLGGTEDVNDGLVLPNNSIIAVGTKDNHFLIAKLSPSGSLDTGFAAPAGFERVVRGTASEADAVVTDDHGRLVVTGTFTMGEQTHLLVIRYLPNGTHDGSFGTAGEVVVPGAPSEQAVAIRTLCDKLLLASTAKHGGTTSFRVRRLFSNGMLDPSFGTGGVAQAMVASGNTARDMIVLSDGRVVVLGQAGNRALLVRFTGKGAVDTLFGPNGTGQELIFIGDYGAPGAIEVYDDHRIVLGGGDSGGSPGPGTFGIVARLWM
jgi:uncharacterized delta-60 repeat protein